MTTQVPGRAVGILLLIAGCQTSPGQFAGCSPNTAPNNPTSAVARQILCDTGAEIVHHPLRAGRTALADQAAWLGSIARGIFGKRLGMPLHGVPPPCPCSIELDSTLLETTVQPASVQLYRDGGAALAVLETMIDSAVRSIDVMIFTWENDAIGWSIAQRLAAWANPNHRLRVLVDGSANLIFPPKRDARAPSQPEQQPPQTTGELNGVVCWLAHQPHVELIRVRNPCAHFDHRKLVLIDGQNAWMGGRNFTHEAFFVRHDISYTLQGPLVAQLQEIYENSWRDQGGNAMRNAECGMRNERQRDVHSALPAPSIVSNAAGCLVANSPTEHSLRKALYRAIDRARCFIYLENPYFTDNGVIVKLARARRRGVDARVIFTIHSESPSINRANKATANRLLAAGVRVYLYPRRLHTKAALIDGVWAYLGSGNFDLLSLHRNHEIGVVFGPSPIVQDIERVLFQSDLHSDWELTAPLPLTIEDRAYEMLAAFFF